VTAAAPAKPAENASTKAFPAGFGPTPGSPRTKARMASNGDDPCGGMGGGEGHSHPEGPSPPVEDANTESPRPPTDRREEALLERGDWIPDA
jgi:hypothetical protein